MLNIQKFLIFFLFITISYACTENSDCDFHHICKTFKCVHKDVFPLTHLEILAFISVSLVSTISVISGMGGGGLYTSILMVILNYSTNVAVPIASFNMVCTFIIKFIWELLDRYKKKKASHVRYDIAAIFCPSLIIGTQIGVIFNILLHPWMLCALLVTVLTISSIPTLKKGIELYKQERAIRDSEKRGLTHPQHLEKNKSLTAQQLTEEQEVFRKRDLRLLPFDYLAYILVGIGCLSIVTILKGRKGTSIIDTKACSPVWWTLSIIMIPIGSILLIFIIRKLRSVHDAQVLVNYVDPSNTVTWNVRTIKWMAIFGLLNGLITSFLVVGGAFITIPLLMSFGVTAMTSTSTASFIAMLSSISSCIQYFMYGMIDLDIAVMTGSGTLTGAFIGLYWLLPYFLEHNMQSAIILTRVFCIFLSIFINGGISISLIVKAIEDGTIWRFNSIC